MRQPITEQQIRDAISATIEKLNARLLEKGNGTFASKHEILGILQEEMLELTDAVHSGGNDDLRDELLDVAVGAIFGVACLGAGKMDW